MLLAQCSTVIEKRSLFAWDSAQKESFSKVKGIISTSPGSVLAYLIHAKIQICELTPLNTVLELPDHKPLVSIMQKSILNCSARLKRMILQLQRCSFKLVHVPGKQIPVADALYRKNLPHTVQCQSSPRALRLKYRKHTGQWSSSRTDYVV